MNTELTIQPVCKFAVVLFMAWLQMLPAQKKTVPVNDLSVSIHEETINKVLAALGDISGTSDYEVLLVKGTYTWTISNAKINIRPDSSFYTCDALVKVGPFSYKTPVVGNVKITYDTGKDKILIKITRAVFELYTYAFGKKIHIKDVHLEERFKEPFSFEGPGYYVATMDFAMPDSTVKQVVFKPVNCKMEMKWKEVCTACEMDAKPVLPVANPGATKKDSTKVKK